MLCVEILKKRVEEEEHEGRMMRRTSYNISNCYISSNGYISRIPICILIHVLINQVLYTVHPGNIPIPLLFSPTSSYSLLLPSTPSYSLLLPPYNQSDLLHYKSRRVYLIVVGKGSHRLVTNLDEN